MVSIIEQTDFFHAMSFSRRRTENNRICMLSRNNYNLIISKNFFLEFLDIIQAKFAPNRKTRFVHYFGRMLLQLYNSFLIDKVFPFFLMRSCSDVMFLSIA